jgi:hypothetical protein
MAAAGGPRGVPPPEDFDDQDAAGTARAWRAMTGRVAWIGGVVRRRRINRLDRGVDQLPGARDVGLAAGLASSP